MLRDYGIREVFPGSLWYLFQLTSARSIYSQDSTNAEVTLLTVLKNFGTHSIKNLRILPHFRTCFCLRLTLLFWGDKHTVFANNNYIVFNNFHKLEEKKFSNIKNWWFCKKGMIVYTLIILTVFRSAGVEKASDQPKTCGRGWFSCSKN